MLAALDRLEVELAVLRARLASDDGGEAWYAAARELRREWLDERAAAGRPVT